MPQGDKTEEEEEEDYVVTGKLTSLKFSCCLARFFGIFHSDQNGYSPHPLLECHHYY